jgi:hypothetical protein
MRDSMHRSVRFKLEYHDDDALNTPDHFRKEEIEESHADSDSGSSLFRGALSYGMKEKTSCSSYNLSLSSGGSSSVIQLRSSHQNGIARKRSEVMLDQTDRELLIQHPRRSPDSPPNTNTNDTNTLPHHPAAHRTLDVMFATADTSLLTPRSITISPQEHETIDDLSLLDVNADTYIIQRNTLADLL